MSGQIRVTLRRSKAGGSLKQQANLQGLGLKKIRQSKTLEDTSAVRGMIAKVSHMVEVENL